MYIDRLVVRGKCVNRELNKYEGLKSYFLSASGAGDRFRRFKINNFDMRSTSSFDYVQRTVESFDTINLQLIERPELLNT